VAARKTTTRRNPSRKKTGRQSPSSPKQMLAVLVGLLLLFALNYVDRFEGDIAVCEAEDGRRREIIRSLLPEGAREGSAVEFDEDGNSRLIDDSERVNRIAAKIKSILKTTHIFTLTTRKAHKFKVFRL
jgi:hypothetical protein